MSMASKNTISIATIFILGLIWRVVIVRTYSFDGLYGQDPYAYFNFAQSLNEYLSFSKPLPPFFWPWGYPLILLLGKFLGTPEISINILLGSLIPSLIFLTCLELKLSLAAAVIGGIVTAISGQILFSSLAIMSDIPGMFWILMSCLCLIKGLNTSNYSHILIAGLFLAIAGITRWISLILLIPWGVAVFGRYRNLGSIFRLILPIIILTSLQLWFSSNSKFDALDHHFLGNWSLKNFWAAELTGLEGVVSTKFPNLIFYSKALSDPFFIHPFFVLLVGLGLLGIFQNSQRSHVILLIGWGLSTYLFLSGLPVQNPRYCLQVFPIIAILTAFGFDYFKQRLKITSFIDLILIVGIIGVSVISIKANTRQVLQLIEIYNSDKLVANWISKAVTPKTPVYAFGITLTLQHYHPELTTKDIYFESIESLSTELNKDVYFVVDIDNIKSQWKDSRLGETLNWLKNREGFKLIGKNGKYSLFKING